MSCAGNRCEIGIGSGWKIGSHLNNKNMLSKKQWQWFVDNHELIRWFCSWLIVVLVILFLFLGLYTSYRTGKVETTWIYSNKNRVLHGCVKEEAGASLPVARELVAGGGSAYIKYETPSLFDWKYKEFYDVRVLEEDAICFSAYLLDQLLVSRQNKIVLIDKADGRVVYVIDPVAQIDHSKIIDK